MSRRQACLIAIVLLTIAGAVHGKWSGRWVGGAERAAAVDRLAALPMQIGDWTAEVHQMDERERQVAGIDGCVLRRYTHGPTGDAVSVLLVCGPPGPVSVHTPEVCYSGAGYALLAAPTRMAVTCADVPEPVPFRTALFRKEGTAASDHLRVFWCWYDGGRWAAPDRPRWTFARARVLYKLYVVNHAPAVSQAAEEDRAVRFLQVLLPELQKTLASP
jgi:Protein of unknown function (DUF3485)